ncbi:hypothetical protein H8B02_41340 [Bradyrhizobium sp. Pear77]|nr:hypothetical protein [Bradyrhizobium altum]
MVQSTLQTSGVIAIVVCRANVVDPLRMRRCRVNALFLKAAKDNHFA